MIFNEFIESIEGKKLLNKFLSKYKESSRKVCQSDILQFSRSCKIDVLQLSESDMIDYRNSLAGVVSSKSLTRKISILKKFFSFLEHHIKGFTSPISSEYGAQSKYQTEYYKTERYQTDLSKWLNSLLLTKGTKETYRINVNLFFVWSKCSARELTKDVINNYKGYLSKYEESTIWLKFVALNSFLKFSLGVEKAAKLISFKNLGLIPPKKDKGYYQVLNQDEIKRLLEQPDNTMYGMRNSAILWLMCTYGLRANEVCKLKYGDFEGDRINNQQKLWIRDRKGKANQRANTAIILNGKCLTTFDNWLSIVREQIDIDDETPIFNQFKWNLQTRSLELYQDKIKDKRQLTVRTIQNIINKYSNEANIERKFKVSPHALRHSALTLLAKAGVELIDLKYLAGHQNISTTMIYIHSVQAYDDHVGLYHPLNK